MGSRKRRRRRKWLRKRLQFWALKRIKNTVAVHVCRFLLEAFKRKDIENEW